MGFLFKAGDYDLPAPVSFSVDDEIIWSQDTGRTLAGEMVGDPVAEKKKVSVEWAYLPETEVSQIKSRLIAGFFPVTFRDDGVDVTIETYRGTMSKEILGNIGDGNFWYRSVKVNLVQR